MNHEKLTSTHRKLTLIFTAVVFCIVLVLGLSILAAKYYNELRIAKRDFGQTTREITNIIETDRAFPQWFLMRQVREKRGRFWDIRQEFWESPLLSTSFFILDTQGEVVFQNILEKPSFAELKTNMQAQAYVDDNTIIRTVVLTESSLWQEVIFFKKLRYGTNQLFEEIMFLFGITFLFSLLFYFIGYRFVERALKPVEENLKDMSDFIHNAGHELKTPLAVMRWYLQVMQAEEAFDTKLLKKSVWEVDSMNALIEWLRELSEVGKNTSLQSVSLTSEIEHIIWDFSDLLEEKNIEVSSRIPASFHLYTNKQELTILLSNIIKNAIKYNKKGWKIEIYFKKNILSISDSWQGISKSEQNKIFERFYQGTNWRSEEGFGIGLSLVKKIADANGWKVCLKSELKKGSTFEIRF